jgi:subtilisin family serine protease
VDVYGKIYVAKVAGCDGNTTNYLMGKAIGESAAWAGTKVINVSHRTVTTENLNWIDWGVQTARGRGVVVVASAGNDYGRSARVYPAASAGVLGVAATDRAGNRANFSNIGPYNVDLAAPGVGICTTAMTSQGNYLCPDGTSFAAPLVAGIAMLVRARYPNDSVDQIEARLKSVSWNPACGKWNCYTNAYGAGIIQANWAVR